MRPGDVLDGRFRLDAAVAVGGSGEVFRAWDLLLDRNVAIKALLASILDTPGTEAELKREVTVTQSLNHPHIVSVFDYRVHVEHGRRRPYVVMQWVDGPSLAEVIAKRPAGLDLGAFLRTASETLAAVQEAHQLGIVHCDLKPANILLTAQGRVKVSDFGIARPIGAVRSGGGLIAVTPEYAAPEQIRGAAATVQTDIYALGCVFFEMLTGRPPFSGGNQAEVLRQHENETAPAVASVPPWLNKVLSRCLAKDPRQRFQSAHDLRMSLSRRRSSGGFSIDTLMPRLWPMRKPRATVRPSPASSARTVRLTTSPGRGDRLPLLSLTMPRGTRYTLVVVMLSLAALVVALLVVILGAGGRSVGGALEATVGPLESPAPVPATGVVEPAQPAQSDARSSRSPLVAEKRTAAALTPGRGASGAAGVSSNDEGIIALVDRAKDLEAAGAYREAINILERALLAAPASPVLRAAIDRTRAAQGAEIRVYLNSADRYLALPIPDYQAAIGAYQSALRLGAGADVQAALKQALAEYDVMRKVLGRGGGGGSTPDGDIK